MMSQQSRLPLLSILVVLLVRNHVNATEPNENFAQATVLSPGVLSVSDDLTSGVASFPDTLLGIQNSIGQIIILDDNGSPLGDGFASGVGGAPVNSGGSGSIDFVVTGFPDEFFEGIHSESGEYEVFVDVYDLFDDLVDQFSQTAMLQPGNVDEYSFSDFEWLGGSYDVYIDNTVGGAGTSDVDFFTFTGLAPGASFSAEVTQEVFSGFDSLLGWFNDAGALIEVDDDDGVETLSLVEGTVPASGELAFAVTGFGDDDFLGDHFEDAMYSLELSLSIAGDFDNDGDVDGRDFLVWQRGNSPNPLSAGDLADWEAHYGLEPPTAVQAVPEPGLLGVLSLVGILGILTPRRYGRESRLS